MMMVASFISRQLVGIIVIVYCIGFWFSATRLPDGPAVIYPQLVIVVLGGFLIADLIASVAKVSTGKLTPDDQLVADDRTGIPAEYPLDKVPLAVDGDGKAPPVALDVGQETERVGVFADSPGEALRQIWAARAKIVVTGVLTLVYMLLIPRLGFYAASAIFLGVMFPYLGVRRPWTLVALWVGSMAAFWLLFDLMLSVRLPGGLLM